MKFVAGDKIKYIGPDSIGLWIKSGKVYTFKGYYTDRTIQLQEIVKQHDYLEREFVYANSHIIKERLGIK